MNCNQVLMYHIALLYLDEIIFNEFNFHVMHALCNFILFFLTIKDLISEFLQLFHGLYQDHKLYKLRQSHLCLKGLLLNI